MPSEGNTTRKPIVLQRGAGRSYDLGAITAVFKADREETGSGYSISEWWLEPHTAGPGAHAHDEDDIFYVLDGTAHVLVGETWVEAGQGAFVLVPGGVTHDFENRGDARVGLLNLSFPGGFEADMPGIAQWFRDNR